MKYAVELYFDRVTESRLTDLARGIADQGISEQYLAWKTRPHITLACFSDADEEACREKLMAFAESHGPLPAYIGSVGMFPDTKTVFVSPVMTEEMYRLHRELHACLAGIDTAGYEWYLPDRWVPHCAVALTKEDGDNAFFAASDWTLRHFQKLAGRFEAVGLVKISFPVEEMFTLPLTGRRG